MLRGLRERRGRPFARLGWPTHTPAQPKYLAQLSRPSEPSRGDLAKLTNKIAKIINKLAKIYYLNYKTDDFVYIKKIQNYM